MAIGSRSGGSAALPLTMRRRMRRRCAAIRLALVEAELPERLFAELGRPLAAKGLFVKAGTLIDATVVEADGKRPPKAEGEVSARDPDAGFSRRRQRSIFGSKAHIAVDQGTDLIRGAILTGAEVGDRLAADALIQGDEAAVYAHKADDGEARRRALAAAWQTWMTIALTPIRAQVERLFGLMKRSYGYRRVRYHGLARNRAQLLLMGMATNLRRADRLPCSGNPGGIPPPKRTKQELRRQSTPNYTSTPPLTPISPATRAYRTGLH